MALSELSREMPHFPLSVVEERMSGGAGANTATNFAALGVASVKMISVIGKDWRGQQLLRGSRKPAYPHSIFFPLQIG